MLSSKTVSVNLGSGVEISFEADSKKVHVCDNRTNRLHASEIPQKAKPMPEATNVKTMDGDSEITFALTPLRYQPVADIVADLPDGIREIVSKMI